MVDPVYHWNVEQARAEDLEQILNQVQFDGYDVYNIISLGEEEEKDSEEVHDVLLVVGRRNVGSGDKGRKKLGDILEESEEEYDLGDEDEDDEDKD